MILNELDPEIMSKFERRGWLHFLDISHPPPIALIREFYSNLFIHSDDSNTHYVMSWIRRDEYVITPSVVAYALGMPLVRQLVYPYSETPPLDDIMSYLTGTSIQWDIHPHITSHELTEIHYLLFWISCHSIWPISHMHIIPIERCAFLYAFVTDAPMSFLTLFIHSLGEVYRSSFTAHGLFFLVFIHNILLHLGLEDFPASEPIHIITLINATFLRQRAAQMRASSKRPRVETSTGVATQPPSSGDLFAEAYVDPTTVVDPPPSSSGDLSIWSMLDTIMTVQGAYG